MDALVRVNGREVRLSTSDAARFGRTDDGEIIGLDERDLGISRCAGEIRLDDAGVWVENLSETRPLWLDLGAGHLTVLSPGRRQVLPPPRGIVVVRGAIREHALEVEVHDPGHRVAEPPRTPAGRATIAPGEVVALTDAEKDALIAVVADYLRPPPRRRALPRGYEEAAALLPGTSGSTVRKRIERIIAKFAAAGTYFTGADARHELADFVVEHGIVGPGDLDRLVLD